MTQWSPVKGANLLVDPRAQQRKERREQRYPAPPRVAWGLRKRFEKSYFGGGSTGGTGGAG